ncbi:MAG: ABC transporter ATP-binding protein/permease [Candidatus Symbiobacter sp.]|nr:ABC transporter ATP-binding protein/permease [Candidatus Symbiobacter sp.]
MDSINQAKNNAKSPQPEKTSPPAGSAAPPALWQTVASLLPYLWQKQNRGLRSRVVLSLSCLILSKICIVMVPLFFKFAVDGLTGKMPSFYPELAAYLPPSLVGAVALILAYGIIRVMGQGFGELRDVIFAHVTQRAVRQVALDTFRHVHALSLRFHLDRQTGGLSRTLERGAKGIEFVLQFSLLNILPTTLEIIFVSLLLWSLFGLSVAAITAATLLCYIVFTITITEWRTQFRSEMNNRDTEASSKTVDSLLNYETVKYFNNESHELKRFDLAMQAYENAAVKSLSSLGMLNIGQGLIIAVGLVAVMGLAAHDVAQGTMTVGDFVAVNTFLIQLYLPLNFLGFVYRQMRQSLSDMQAMFALLQVDREVADIANAPDLHVSHGEIRFESVGFAYDARRPVLENISFSVPPGKVVAVVGSSGAGKSTLSRLMFRFYEPQAGRITIDGQDIQQVTQNSLRRSIGIVPQDTVLFNDTIYYNILYGRPDASPSEVEEAAKLARIHDFILGLPDQYDTRVGERGLKLSGGEKQRVAIARVILKRPQILIFDEATSALDTKTERAIQQSLNQVAENRTSLIIAHRLSTIVHADEILVLDGGHIVERGRHSALLAQNGRYATMWQRQLETVEMAS